jgi:EAL and modified HD-GYP domain-containing signal transduction protein
MDAFIARQPIFDTRNKVIGYDLLHRDNQTPSTKGVDSSPESDSAELVGDPFGIGMEELSGGKTAFIHVPNQLLLDGVGDRLDPGAVVIQLSEKATADETVVGACKGLASQGFRFAMDDYVLGRRFASLKSFAKIVQVDVRKRTEKEKKMLSTQLVPLGMKLLAKRVENQTVHEECLGLGFELFQGFHYFRPETLTSKDLSVQSISVVRLLNLLKDMNAKDAAIQEAFRADPTLSYKLLRMVNSAALGGRGVDSIGHALRILGRDPLYRWLSMLLLAEGRSGSEVKTEIIKSSLLRGRMCELLGDGARGQMNRDIPPGGTLFLVGLFSHLDTLLQSPMDEMLEKIDLANGVKEALLEREGLAGTILSAVEAFEDAEWEAAEELLASLGTAPSILSDSYLDSVTWAGNRMQMHGD